MSEEKLDKIISLLAPCLKCGHPVYFHTKLEDGHPFWCMHNIGCYCEEVFK